LNGVFLTTPDPMSHTDFRTPRLYVDDRLAAGAEVTLDRDRANYLFNVLRLEAGDAVLLFNGRDGEWRATVASAGKRSGALALTGQARPQPAPGRVELLFAPLKHARLDYMVQKAVEMGAARIQPVLTRHTQVARVNTERMRANVIEAAQQCGVLALAEVGEPLALERTVASLAPGRLVVFCDEDADLADPVAALNAAPAHDGVALVIGPEGGFSQEERAMLLGHGNIVRLSLGPRILRADTAAVAALALVQAVLGDWR
jgi:16S rRNA (uracil1498-N3)-methyltransferase